MEEDINLIEEYRALPLSNKRQKLGKAIAEMTVVTEKLLSDLNPNYTQKPVDEYSNLFEGTTSEDEYLTGLYDDVLDLQEAMALYYEFATNLYYDKNTNQDIN